MVATGLHKSFVGNIVSSRRDAPSFTFEEHSYGMQDVLATHCFSTKRYIPTGNRIDTIICSAQAVFFALKGQGILAQGKAYSPPPWVSRHPKPLAAL